MFFLTCVSVFVKSCKDCACFILYVFFCLFCFKTFLANHIFGTNLMQSENGKEWITVSATTLSVNPLFYTHKNPFVAKPYSAYGSKYSSVSIVPSKSKYIRNWNMVGYETTKDEFDAKGKSRCLYCVAFL